MINVEINKISIIAYNPYVHRIKTQDQTHLLYQQSITNCILSLMLFRKNQLCLPPYVTYYFEPKNHTKQTWPHGSIDVLYSVTPLLSHLLPPSCSSYVIVLNTFEVRNLASLALCLGIIKKMKQSYSLSKNLSSNLGGVSC